VSQHGATANYPMCDGRGSRDVSDVFRRQAASVNVPPKIPSLDHMNTLATWAQDLARTLLADPLPRRWAHVQGVAAQARTLTPSLGTQSDVIEAAAWQHDIGYLAELAATGLHGLDGARYLRDVQHAEPLLCRLVAHHSCAVIEAEERGLAAILTREFTPPPQELADALTFCDMTTSPDGEHVQVTHRLAEIHDRYGTGHLVSRFIRRATPLILQAVGHVNARTASTTGKPPVSLDRRRGSRVPAQAGSAA
jgi:HD domain